MRSHAVCGMCCGITGGVGGEKGERGRGRGGAPVLASGLHLGLCLYGLILCSLLGWVYGCSPGLDLNLPVLSI